MSRPRHHINPRRDLLRFTDDDENFYYFRKDRPDEGIKRRNPRSVMSRRGYYALVDPNPGEHAGSVEDRLKWGEEEANRVIDRLLDQIGKWKATIPDGCSRRRREYLARMAQFSPPIRLSDSEVGILKRYIAWKFMRTERREEAETSVLEELMEDAIIRLAQEAIEGIDHDWLRRRVRDMSNRIVGHGPSEVVGAIFAQKGVVVSTTAGQRVAPLVASDEPVLKAIPKGMNLLDELSEIYMPISKDTVLSIYGTPGLEFKPVLDTRLVRHINEGTFSQSKEAACANKKVLESLIRAERENRLYLKK